MDTCEAAEAFIDLVNDYGIEDIFFNPGGEMAKIQAAIAKRRLSGERAPRLVLCLDESVAMTAASGHYMVSGRPQVVMVHAELGTQQVGGALHNAQWGRVPVILWAGAFPEARRVNVSTGPFDQGSMVRNCVKWDHKISADEDFIDILQQGFKVAVTEPSGPVYLCYPREILNQKVDRVSITPWATLVPRPVTASGMTGLKKAAGVLIEAKKPLILAGYTGRYHQSVASLVELAETLCAPVLTGPTRMNFPTTHPLCAGIEQILGSTKPNPYMADADVLLVIDYDMPYAIAEGVPGPDTRIIHIDADALAKRKQLWGRGADIYIQADSREAMPALNKLIRQMITPEKGRQLGDRFKRLEKEHEKQRRRWRNLAISCADQRPISPDWLGHCIAEITEEDTIVLNHTICHSTSVTEQIPRTMPGTLLSCAGGSIQWALGAALGAKVAAPDRTVISIMTDGGFVWGCPVATLYSANLYRAPFLSVIFNNQSYGYIKQHVHRTSGEKEFPDEMAFEAGVDITSPPDYAAIAQACGAYGRMVADPAEVLPVLKEAIDRVHSGQAAVVDVRLARG